MKNQSALLVAATACLLCFANINFAQAPNLRTSGNFVLFSSVGAVGNTGISQLTGNIGTNSGAITSFGNVNGVMHNADSVTAKCVIDLEDAWYQLDTSTITATHAPVLGNGDTLYAGVYSIAAAGSLVSDLTLDAQGNPDAVFIFKTGGAFTTAASSTVNLVNGALACNVFWKAEGAIGMAALTTMRGTLIAHNGAISVGAGCTLEGRALSTTGAVTVYGTLAYIPIGCGRPILTGPSAPMLGTLECYALFSSDGVVSNSGITYVKGDVGTNTDSTTGYDPLLVTGIIHLTPDLATGQCAYDFLSVYAYLDTIPYDIELLYPAQFGNKLVLTPHTYLMNAAASLTDTLYLNAEGNPDAIFIIKINGALSTGAYSAVRLINGTQAKNVYWVIEGAATINDYSVFNGTIICNHGAITLNAGVKLEGRGLTTSGAVTTIAVTTDNTSSWTCNVLPIELLSFTGLCDKQNVVLKWSTTTSSDYFSVERSADRISWQAVGLVKAVAGSFTVHSYFFVDKAPDKIISYYRLKQFEFNGDYKYGNVIAVKKCGAEGTDNFTLYPNPSNGNFDLLFTGNRSRVQSTEIFSTWGKKIYESKGFQSKFDLSGNRPVYILYIFTCIQKT